MVYRFKNQALGRTLSIEMNNWKPSPSSATYAHLFSNQHFFKGCLIQVVVLLKSKHPFL